MGRADIFHLRHGPQNPPPARAAKPTLAAESANSAQRAYYSTCVAVADFVLVYTVLRRDVACRMECS
jgi:hypothetical protein